MRFDCHNPVLVPGVGIGHKYFSGEKFRDPVSSACADSDLRCPDHGTSTAQSDLCVVVPGVGIEPTFLSEHDLKSCAYTNSATRAPDWKLQIGDDRFAPWRPRRESHPRVTLLQRVALLLGYGAVFIIPRTYAFDQV